MAAYAASIPQRLSVGTVSQSDSRSTGGGRLRGATAVDLFAGAGGFTTGATAAGVKVLWAANHDPEACRYHAANHPGTEHCCQDLQQADWRSVPPHDITLASPACQGHSKARGKEKPHHDALRSTAWAVVSCAECHRSPFVIVENVPAFLEWELYPAWAAAMQLLGYSVSPHLVDSADHGVPQQRPRLFVICTRSKHPIQLRLPQRQHRAFRECVEWDRYRWRPIRTPRRSAATLRRVANGREAFGDTFVFPYYKSGSGLTGRSIDRPIGTITTIDRWAIVRGDEMRMVQPSELVAAMAFPMNYILPKKRREAIHFLGNAVCPPVATDILEALAAAA